MKPKPKKIKKIKAWAVVNKEQQFGQDEQIDCFTSLKSAEEHLKHYENNEELRIISCEIILKSK